MRAYNDVVTIEEVNKIGGGICRLSDGRAVGFCKFDFNAPKAGDKFSVFVSEGRYITIYDAKRAA